MASNELVVDCRACGGLIVQPSPLVISVETEGGGYEGRVTRSRAKKGGWGLLELVGKRARDLGAEMGERRGDDEQDSSEPVALNEEPDGRVVGVRGERVGRYMGKRRRR